MIADKLTIVTVQAGTFWDLGSSMIAGLAGSLLTDSLASFIDTVLAWSSKKAAVVGAASVGTFVPTHPL